MAGKRLSYISRSHCIGIAVVNAILIIIAIVAGVFGPDMLVEKTPSQRGTGVALANPNTRCAFDETSGAISPRIPRCWNHEF